MIDSSTPRGSIQRFIQTEIVSDVKKYAPKVAVGIVTIIALGIIGHFSAKMMLLEMPATNSLAGRVGIACLDVVWGIVTVLSVGITLLLPVGVTGSCIQCYDNWKSERLASIQETVVHTPGSPLITASNPIDV